MSKAAPVTASDFDSVVLRSSVPVLVDFWAAWCPPCRRVAPTIDAAAEQWAGRATVVKVDVDSEAEIAARYGIQSIPALFLFKGGRVVEQLFGDQPLSEISAKLSAHTG